MFPTLRKWFGHTAEPSAARPATPKPEAPTITQVVLDDAQRPYTVRTIRDFTGDEATYAQAAGWQRRGERLEGQVRALDRTFPGRFVRDPKTGQLELWVRLDQRLVRDVRTHVDLHGSCFFDTQEANWYWLHFNKRPGHGLDGLLLAAESLLTHYLMRQAR